MRKRADTRFWISIIASAFVFPVAAIAMFTVWFVRLQSLPPTITVPSPAMLAATRPIPPVRAQVETAATPRLEAVAEPAAPSPAAQTSVRLATMPVLGSSPRVSADPVRDASTAESARMPVEPAAAAISPQPKQQTPEIAEAAAPQSDAKVSEHVFVHSMNEMLAVTPPMMLNTLPADVDLARDTLPHETAVMLIQPVVSEPSRLIEDPIPLPRLRPRIAVAYGSHTAPLPRPRPIENSPPWSSQQ
jgi:hypothetical protein